MQAASPVLAAFIRSQIQTPVVYGVVQTPTPDGARVATQMVLPNALSMQVTRSADKTSDTAQFSISDDAFAYSPVSKGGVSKYAAAFQPGVIDNKFLIYLGYEGSQSNVGGYTPRATSSMLRFTGYLETDDQKVSGSWANVKGASLVDLTKQFRYSVYDTFPHPLYGDQTSSFFDPAYNLLNPSLDGTTWVCEGKMFTQSNVSQFYGTTHIDPAVFVDVTGGGSPAATAVPNTGWTVTGNIGTCDNYTFDYAGAILTFTTAGLTLLGYPGGLPVNSIVSMAGNPTYMAPEVMIRKIICEKGNWDPSFLKIDTSNVLINQYVAQDMAAWDCVKEICDLCCPRFLPWIMYVDANGFMHFEETTASSPPVKYYLDERDLLTLDLSYSSQQISTVVRADGDCYTSSGDQAITSVSYSLPAIARYGQTTALLLDKHLSYNVRHLTPPNALAALNMLTGATLAQVDRPTQTLQLSAWPDYTLEVNDKIVVRSKKTGIDQQFLITAISEKVDPGAASQTITATDFYDPTNFLFGSPAGVAYDSNILGATAAPPPTALISSILCGSGAGSYPFVNGAPNYDPNTLDQVIPVWDFNDGTPMNFSVFLGNTTAASASGIANNPYSYSNLPPGFGWAPYTNNVGDTVYYGIDPSNGETVYVGTDNVFYEFAHALPITPSDLGAFWTPPGNISDSAPGQSTSTTGFTAWMWTWWYLCLNGSGGVGNNFRPIMRPVLANDGAALTVPDAGLWVNQTWTGGPGPTTDGRTFLYGNVAAGLTDYTPTPPGFVGAAAFGTDPTQIGVAFGNAVTTPMNYMNYQKVNRGHFCVYVVSSTGVTQFARVPFDLHL